ncbi:MAG: 50S ribosomal protein L6 [bacterium]|nr:50S ribosomal protein L6 [bacterium]
MSRIGKRPVELKEGVTVTQEGSDLLVRGPKGELTVHVPKEISSQITDNEVLVTRSNDSKISKSLHGSTVRILSNAVHGVTLGWEKKLELRGTGYRARLDGSTLILAIGYSHPVTFLPIEGINFLVTENIITVEGIDRHLVGQISANIKAERLPDSYKGKGIRYLGEYIRTKPGKAAAKAAA